jgi:hypothetical protein
MTAGIDQYSMVGELAESIENNLDIVLEPPLVPWIEWSQLPKMEKRPSSWLGHSKKKEEIQKNRKINCRTTRIK